MNANNVFVYNYFLDLSLIVFAHYTICVSPLESPGPSAPTLPPSSPLLTDSKAVVLKGSSFIFQVIFLFLLFSHFHTDPFQHSGEIHTERVEVVRPVILELGCTWTGNPDRLPNVTGFWRKNGIEIEGSRLTVPLENEQYNLRRT